MQNRAVFGSDLLYLESAEGNCSTFHAFADGAPCLLPHKFFNLADIDISSTPYACVPTSVHDWQSEVNARVTLLESYGLEKMCEYERTQNGRTLCFLHFMLAGTPIFFVYERYQFAFFFADAVFDTSEYHMLRVKLRVIEGNDHNRLHVARYAQKEHVEVLLFGVSKISEEDRVLLHLPYVGDYSLLSPRMGVRLPAVVGQGNKFEVKHNDKWHTFVVRGSCGILSDKDAEPTKHV